MAKAKTQQELRKFLWRSADDARDFLKKQLLELSFRDILALGFYFIVTYTAFRGLGRVPQIELDDLDEVEAEGIPQQTVFWAIHRSLFINVLQQLEILFNMEIPGTGYKPLRFLHVPTGFWLWLITRVETPPVNGRFYYKAVPLEQRVLLILGVVSLMFIMQLMAERLISEIGEIIPL